MLGVDHVAGVFHFRLYAIRRNARVFRRPRRRIEAKVDDRNAAAGLERCAQLAEVVCALVDVMVDVDEYYQIDRRRNAGIVGCGGDRRQVGEVFFFARSPRYFTMSGSISTP